jgi:hypothetical protein
MYTSCNGTVAGTTGDGVDLIASISDLVQNNAGSSHAWFVVRSTGLASNFQVLVSCESADSDSKILTVYFSVNAGFTGGTTTARPTATDEVPLLLAANWLTGSATDTSSNLYWNLQTDSTGAIFRFFVFYANFNILWIQFEKLNPAESGVTYPIVACILGGTTGSHRTTGANLSGSKNVWAHPVGTPVQIRYSSYMSGTQLDAITCTTANSYSGEWPTWDLEAFDFTHGVPIGRFTDLYAGSAGKAARDGYPSGTRVWVHISPFLILPAPSGNGNYTIS